MPGTATSPTDCLPVVINALGFDESLPKARVKLCVPGGLSRGEFCETTGADECRADAPKCLLVPRDPPEQFGRCSLACADGAERCDSDYVTDESTVTGECYCVPKPI
jgi:hypothetical protein